jgi:hypothetical protein
MTTYEIVEGTQNPITAPSIMRFNDDGSITSIPVDPANSDYQTYLESLKSDK